MRKFLKIILIVFLGIIAFLALSVILILSFLPSGDDTKTCGTAFLITLDDPTSYNETMIISDLKSLQNFSATHLLDKVKIESPNNINVSLIRMPFTTTNSEAQDFNSALKKIDQISKVKSGNSCFIEEIYWQDGGY